VATFNHPQGLAVDSHGNVFVVDQYNNAVNDDECCFRHE